MRGYKGAHSNEVHSGSMLSITNMIHNVYCPKYLYTVASILGDLLLPFYAITSHSNSTQLHENEVNESLNYLYDYYNYGIFPI